MEIFPERNGELKSDKGFVKVKLIKQKRWMHISLELKMQLLDFLVMKKALLGLPNQNTLLDCFYDAVWEIKES